jgi:dipeptidyl aminopeptidase/acylaminoacyl peptidase
MTFPQTHMNILKRIVLLTCIACSAAAQAHPSASSAQTFEQAAIAPDGSRLAWVQPLSGDNGEDTGRSAIFVQDLKKGGKPAHVSAAVTNADADEGSLAWSPDSRKLAFLSDVGNPGQLELYLYEAGGGQSRKLTSLTGYLADPSWSPDGKTVALLLTENAPRVAGPLMPMTPETGVIGSKVYEQRLTLVDVASGEARQISPPGMYVYEYDWSPDGKSFALTSAQGAGDGNWYVAQLYTLAAAGGEMKAIYKPPLQIAGPRWSPDGRNIAFIAGIMSDEGITGGDVFVVSAHGGEARDVTPGIPASPSAVYWETPDRLLFAETIDGDSGVGVVNLADHSVGQLWRGPEAVTDQPWGGGSLSFAADRHTTAVIRDSAEHPPEVWVGPVGEWRQVTRRNDAVKPVWGEMKSLHWTNDGLHVQGWLMYPKDYDPGKRYPMVVVVHGGPAWAAFNVWPGRFFSTYELSVHGYFVLYPNPRGSYGQGESFTHANAKDFGYGDFRDILAGVDKVVKTLPVDNNRIGITGWSYGGYMTMWAVTQTQRFRAAVAGAGLSNWLSYYGENDIDEWMIPYFGASVYQDPVVYARSSPINFITRVVTPTLVLVGERDGEVPAPQSREFWHALKTLGVETQLVIYPGEGHAILEPEHQRDIMERMLGWFDDHMKPNAPSPKG